MLTDPKSILFRPLSQHLLSDIHGSILSQTLFVFQVASPVSIQQFQVAMPFLKNLLLAR
jgi:hypothetical protein